MVSVIQSDNMFSQMPKNEYASQPGTLDLGIKFMQGSQIPAHPREDNINGQKGGQRK